MLFRYEGRSRKRLMSREALTLFFLTVIREGLKLILCVGSLQEEKLVGNLRGNKLPKYGAALCDHKDFIDVPTS